MISRCYDFPLSLFTVSFDVVSERGNTRSLLREANCHFSTENVVSIACKRNIICSKTHLEGTKNGQLLVGPEGNSKFCFNFEKRAEIPATTSGHLWSRATAVNISRVTVNGFPFDVIVFAMLPAHGIWGETASLLDVMWRWTSQWMGALCGSEIGSKSFNQSRGVAM